MQNCKIVPFRSNTSDVNVYISTIYICVFAVIKKNLSASIVIFVTTSKYTIFKIYFWQVASRLSRMLLSNPRFRQHFLFKRAFISKPHFRYKPMHYNSLFFLTYALPLKAAFSSTATFIPSTHTTALMYAHIFPDEFYASSENRLLTSWIFDGSTGCSK